MAMDSQNIRIRLKAFDHRALDCPPEGDRVDREAHRRAVFGPDAAADAYREVHRQPLAARRQEEPRAVRDPHAQARCSTSFNPTPQTVDALMKLDLSAGVDVEIKFWAR